MHQSDSGLTALLAGMFVGAGLGLLLAPRAGEDVRAMLADQLNQTTDELLQRGKAALQTAIEEGKAYLEKPEPEPRRAGQSSVRAR